MCVVSHGYGGLGGGMDGGGEWYARRMKASGRSHIGRCWSTSLVCGDTLITPPYRCTALGRSSLNGLSTGRHEKAPVGYTP